MTDRLTVNVASASEFFAAVRTLALNGFTYDDAGFTRICPPFLWVADFIKTDSNTTTTGDTQ